MVPYHEAKWEETKVDCLNHCQEKKQPLTAQVCRERTSHSTLQPSHVVNKQVLDGQSPFHVH